MHSPVAVALSNSGANNVSLTNNIATVLAASTVGQNLNDYFLMVQSLRTGALTVPGIFKLQRRRECDHLISSK